MSMVQEKMYMDVDDVCAILGVSKTYAYTGIERSGVKRIRLHDLRHSHASMLVDMGVAPLEIAERLGHEKVETTLNTYSHLYPSTQSKLAGLLDKKHEEEEE